MTEGGKPLPGPAGAGGPPLLRAVVLPARDWQIEDTWHVAGLKGTGSHHIVLRDKLVPAGEFLRSGEWRGLPAGTALSGRAATPAAGAWRRRRRNGRGRLGRARRACQYRPAAASRPRPDAPVGNLPGRARPRRSRASGRRGHSSTPRPRAIGVTRSGGNAEGRRAPHPRHPGRGTWVASTCVRVADAASPSAAAVRSTRPRPCSGGCAICTSPPNTPLCTKDTTWAPASCSWTAPSFRLRPPALRSCRGRCRSPASSGARPRHRWRRHGSCR